MGSDSVRQSPTVTWTVCSYNIISNGSYKAMVKVMVNCKSNEHFDMAMVGIVCKWHPIDNDG